MRIIMSWFTGVLLAGNGVFMLTLPGIWYATVPGIVDHGPFNPHFVADIGVANLMSAAGLIWGTLDHRAWPAAVVGAGFVTLHTLLHVYGAVAGHVPTPTAIAEVIGLSVLTAFVLWAVWPRHGLTQEQRNA